MKQHFLGAIALAIAPFLFAACATSSEPTLDEVRAATEKYRDVNAALADGYVRDWMDVCETAYHMGLDLEKHGSMGLHFIRQDLLGILDDETRLDVTGSHTDFLRPAVLVYEPKPNNGFELVAIENMVSAEAWQAAGHSEPPSFQGTEYHFTPDDPRMFTKGRYDLHVWLYRDNPTGMFAQYNPTVTCRDHIYEMPMWHPPGAMGGMSHPPEHLTPPEPEPKQP